MDYKCRTDIPGYHNDESLNCPSLEPVKLTIDDAWDNCPFKHELIPNYFTKTEQNELHDAVFKRDSDEEARFGDLLYRVFKGLYDKATYPADKWAFGE